jgi:DNA-binding response OmpR family regulator
VLVVDDDPGLRLICRFNLEAAGMHVSEASDGESALELATADPPDAILLDVMMPGLDGWAVAAELHERAATRDIPIVFVTARGSDADRERGLELAAAGYVTKPFDPSTLTALIERLLGRREGA